MRLKPDGVLTFEAEVPIFARASKGAGDDKTLSNLVFDSIGLSTYYPDRTSGSRNNVSERETTFSLVLLDRCRGVAQPGRALGSGPRGRRFESSRPDQKS